MRLLLLNDTGLASTLKLLSSARVVVSDKRYVREGLELSGEVCSVTAEALAGYELTKRHASVDPDEVLPPRRELGAGSSRAVARRNPRTISPLRPLLFPVQKGGAA
jgi:hypothetical protein